MSDRNPNGPVCRHCGAEWGGMHTCHCSGCHMTFADERAFSGHRVRSSCVEPLVVGLVDVGRAYQCWGSHDVVA